MPRFSFKKHSFVPALRRTAPGINKGVGQKSVEIEDWEVLDEEDKLSGSYMPVLATQYCMRIEYSVTAMTLSAEKGVGHWQEPKKKNPAQDNQTQ